MEKTIKFEEEEIEYYITYGKIFYKYKGIDSKSVEILQPDIHEKIISKIKLVDEEYQKIEAENKLQKQIIRNNELNQIQQKFKREVEALECVKNSGFKVCINNITGNFYGVVKSFYFDDSCNRIYSSDSNRSNKNWILEYNFKRTKYVKLETAVMKYIEKIKNSVIEKEKKKQEKTAHENKELKIAAFCIDNKLEFEKRWHSARSKYSKGYYTYTGKKTNLAKEDIIFKLSFNNNKIEVISIIINASTKARIEKELQ